ncbi:Pycsar system effector family protein [Catenuloplanes indicus]|uniref:Pycsar effector protein domain-containing protein n=1 Tax=Catenuloplanes indicus TaxID=137267 RepID=A0AAE4B2H2_9ACTN|nr:hypothetical protein [Catenuloplanes indicus]MDQ0363350.1 hypothetical protein [Catenuloplanes indicus]MDQ0371672.1 hypothetical protein [Catenuloplanes indicus]
MTAAVDLTGPVEAAHARVEQQLAKADTKAGIVSTSAVAAVAVFAAAAAATHGSVRAGLVTAAVGAFAALGATLSALWPRLGGDHGFVRWAGMAPDALAAELVESPPVDAAAVVGLSQTAWRKNRAIQAAIVLLFVAPLAGVVTAVAV